MCTRPSAWRERRERAGCGPLPPLWRLPTRINPQKKDKKRETRGVAPENNNFSKLHEGLWWVACT